MSVRIILFHLSTINKTKWRDTEQCFVRTAYTLHIIVSMCVRVRWADRYSATSRKVSFRKQNRLPYEFYKLQSFNASFQMYSIIYANYFENIIVFFLPARQGFKLFYGWWGLGAYSSSQITSHIVFKVLRHTSTQYTVQLRFYILRLKCFRPARIVDCFDIVIFAYWSIT